MADSPAPGPVPGSGLAPASTPVPAHGGVAAPPGAKAPPAGRLRLLDFLRGFSVFSMVAYHTLFDYVYLFGHPMGWYQGWPGYVWQQSICWVFILVSGASLHYGRHTARRGLAVLGCALAVSAVTLLMMPSQRVMSGILHLIAVAMLLSAALRRVLEKTPPAAGAAVCFALFLATKLVPSGYLGLLDIPLLALPEALYQTPFLFPLGLPGPGFFSGDYFPLLPWLFLYWAGYFAWAPLKKRLRPAAPGKNPLEWAGRHSLLIYMLHQPAAYGLLWALAALGMV